MAIKEMRQNEKIVMETPTRPQYYMRMKNYIDTTLRNFNWETMSEKDLNEGLEIIEKVMQQFYKLRTWQPERKNKIPEGIIH